MEMLQLNDLHKTFNPGTVNEKVALNGVSLQMEAGDFATIVGSNGAGKSTLFNAITGGFIADEGSILLGGQDITFAPEHQRSKVIGHLFQDPLKGTAPNMTIEENLALAYLRASEKRSPFSVVTAKDRAEFREKPFDGPPDSLPHASASMPSVISCPEKRTVRTLSPLTTHPGRMDGIKVMTLPPVAKARENTACGISTGRSGQRESCQLPTKIFPSPCVCQT